MPTHISVPLWLAVALAVLAAWALLDRLLMPSARWLLRSRAEKVLDEVAQRLKIRIRPFQQVRRQVLIDRLVFDDKVQLAAHEHATAHGMPRAVALAQVQRYAREIVPAFNAFVYFRVGYWIGKRISRALYRVRIGFTDDAGLNAIPEDATVVFVMNHRSNMDYIVASYLAAERAALSYAVGEWARVWGLQHLIRAMGAYFVRRNSKDELYRRVLERYIAMATEAGVAQAVYPEGGLTKDGRLGTPRYGVIDYMLRGFHCPLRPASRAGPPGGERSGPAEPDPEPADGRDLVFVPLGLNYDRVLEDRTQLLAGDAAAPRPGRLYALGRTLAFVLQQLTLLLRSRWYRLGYACVNFGTPVSVRSWCTQRGVDLDALPKEARHAEVAALGRHLMAEVGRLVPVLPVPLVATVLLRDTAHAFSLLELKAAAGTLVAELQQRGAHLYVPRSDWDYAIESGLRMLTLRRLVLVDDGVYRAHPRELALLRYYANSIVHLLPGAAASATVAPAPQPTIVRATAAT